MTHPTWFNSRQNVHDVLKISKQSLAAGLPRQTSNRQTVDAHSGGVQVWTLWMSPAVLLPNTGIMSTGLPVWTRRLGWKWRPAETYPIGKNWGTRAQGFKAHSADPATSQPIVTELRHLPCTSDAAGMEMANVVGRSACESNTRWFPPSGIETQRWKNKCFRIATCSSHLPLKGNCMLQKIAEGLNPWFLNVLCWHNALGDPKWRFGKGFSKARI